MSMNLYLKAGAQLELMRLMRDEGALTGLMMPRMMGRLRGMGAFANDAQIEAAFSGFDMIDEQLDKQVNDMGKEAWRQGPFAGVSFLMMKGQIRDDLRAMSGQMEAAKQQMRAALSGEAEDEAGDDDICDLHKSWHVLHYLFTGSAWDGAAPGNMLLKGGKEIGEDMGYGRPRVADPAATQAFARFLEPLSTDDLKARIDPKKMARANIYCAEDADDEGAEYELYNDIDHYFPMLKAYVAGAAAKGQSLAIFML